MRRVFLRVEEIPRLFAGLLRGEPVAMRRILGARRAGRVGALLAALGVLAWLGEPAIFGLAIGQLAIALPGAALSRPPLSWLEYQRLSLWLAGAALLAAAPLHAAPALAPHGVWLLWLGSHLWLWRALRRGLDDR
jgi:hypothetical protein